MRNKLTCEQIISLIGFYSAGHLSERLKSHIDKHLMSCEQCRNFYGDYLKPDFRNPVDEKQIVYPDFKTDLSCYIDNELDEKECLRMKKIAITNPVARKD